MKAIEKRTNKGYEIQFYDNDGNNGMVMHCDTIEELAQYLARCCWGNNLADWKNRMLPTVWKDGEKWCHCEYSEP